jgi:ribosomal protein S18 acetylase RimI-like enzyme
MDVRTATIDDVEAIRSVARASLGASYGHVLDEDVLDAAIDEWYDTDSLGEDIDAETQLLAVAVEDGTLRGIAQSEHVEGRENIGYIDWLHVEPDARGRGIGAQLLARVEQELLEQGVERLEGRVLTENDAGIEFYTEQGFSVAGERTVTIEGESFTERIYTAFLDESGSHHRGDERQTTDGQTVYVAFDESVRGSEAPFFAVYADPNHESRYGWLCGGDESLDIAMDTMERIECTTCNNRRKPVRWDAAYL